MDGIKTRKCWVLGEVEGLMDSEKWEKLNSIAMIESVRKDNGKASREIHY